MNTVTKFALAATLLCASPAIGATYCEGQGTGMHCTGVGSCEGIELKEGAFCTGVANPKLPKGVKFVEKGYFKNLKSVKSDRAATGALKLGPIK